MRTISLSNQFMLAATFGLAFAAWGCQLSSSSGTTSAGGSSSGGSSGGGGTGGSSSTLSAAGGSSSALTFDPTKPPCDTYAEDGGPCVAAHSTIRILSSAWAGKKLYQVRVGGSNSGTGGSLQDILAGPNGFADSSAQDTACGSSACTISTIYDQSGQGNDLVHTPAGGGQKPGADNEANAKGAAITVNGQSLYGVKIVAGVGYRNTTASQTATGDNPETEYAVVSGTFFNGSCCFDYGNMETSIHDDGEGTMEAVYFGNCTIWNEGGGSGPWVMGDSRKRSVGRGQHPLQRQPHYSLELEPGNRDGQGRQRWHSPLDHQGRQCPIGRPQHGVRRWPSRRFQREVLDDEEGGRHRPRNRR